MKAIKKVDNDNLIEANDSRMSLGYWEEEPFDIEAPRYHYEESSNVMSMQLYRNSTLLKAKKTKEDMKLPESELKKKIDNEKVDKSLEFKNEQKDYEIERELDHETNAIRNQYIIGKATGKQLLDHSGRVIAESGILISHDIINRAEREGKLIELILNMVWKQES